MDVQSLNADFRFPKFPANRFTYEREKSLFRVLPRRFQVKGVCQWCEELVEGPEVRPGLIVCESPERIGISVVRRAHWLGRTHLANGRVRITDGLMCEDVALDEMEKTTA